MAEEGIMDIDEDDIDVEALDDLSAFDDRLPDFDSTFTLQVTNVVKTPGSNTIYEFKLIAKPNKRILHPREYYVQITDNRFAYAIEDWKLETGEFLDIVPGGPRNEEEFVKRAIRAFFDSDDQEAENYDARERILVDSAGLKMIKGDLYFIPGKSCVYKIKKPGAEGELVQRINEEDLAFKMIFQGEGFKLGTTPSGKIMRVLPEALSQYAEPDDVAVGTNPEPMFLTDEKEALRLLFKMLEAVETVKDDVSQSSLLTFFLQYFRTKMYNFLPLNQRLVILCSLCNNSGKSFFMKQMSLVVFGYKLPMRTGFTSAFLFTELQIPNTVVLIDEFTKLDPLDETAKGVWTKAFRGKQTATKGHKKGQPVPQSSLIGATNKKLKEFASFHKIEKSTYDKFDFNFLGYKSVNEANPLCFEKALDEAEVFAKQMFQFCPVYYGVVWEICNGRVTGTELASLAPYCEKIDERLGQSLAHLHRLYLLLKAKGNEHDLTLPKCLLEFNPQCLTEALSDGDKSLKDLVKFIVNNFAVHVLEPMKGGDIRLNNDELEDAPWCPDWSSKTYEKLPKDAHKRVGKKYLRNVRVTKGQVGLDLFNKAKTLMSITVDKKGDEDIKASNKKMERFENEGLKAVSQMTVTEKERPTKKIRLSPTESEITAIPTQENSDSGNLRFSTVSENRSQMDQLNEEQLLSTQTIGKQSTLNGTQQKQTIEEQFLSYDFQEDETGEHESPSKQQTSSQTQSHSSVETENGTQIEKRLDKYHFEGNKTVENEFPSRLVSISSSPQPQTSSQNQSHSSVGSKNRKREKKVLDCGVPLCVSFTKQNGATTANENKYGRKGQEINKDRDKNTVQILNTLEIDETNQLLRRSERKTASVLQMEKTESILRQLKKDNDNGLGLKVEIIPTKGRGIVTTRDIIHGQFVVEYAGTLLNIESAKQREFEYGLDIGKGCYMYYFVEQGKRYCMDATEETGRLGRLINHSRKQPNLMTKVIVLDGSPRLCLFAKHNIEAGRELLYDYGDKDKNTIKAYPWLDQ